MQKQVEIICVGNEMLIGKTLNTNARWLAKRATAFGLAVKRITVVGDDVDKIEETVREAIRRKPDLIITTGGLGPTFDDRTLGGIAKALDRKLEIDPRALKMVRAKYESYFKEGERAEVELTPPRIKMATLPEGAEPMPNSVGTAPGVKIALQDSVLVALPGVPEEMKSIFDESLAPSLRGEAEEYVFFEASIYSHGIGESNLAPSIDQVMYNNPYVYIKSHPSGRKKSIEIHFSTTAENLELAKSKLKKAIVQMSGLIEDSGGEIKIRTRV